MQWSNPGTPPQLTLHRNDGTLIAPLVKIVPTGWLAPKRRPTRN